MKKLIIAKVDPRITKLIKDIRKNPYIKKFFKLISNRIQPDKQGWRKDQYRVSYVFKKGTLMGVSINFWYNASNDDPFIVNVTDDQGLLRGRGIRSGAPVSMFKTLDNITADDYWNALDLVVKL